MVRRRKALSRTMQAPPLGLRYIKVCPKPAARKGGRRAGPARRSLPIEAGPRPAKPLGEAGLNLPLPPYRPAMPKGVRVVVTVTPFPSGPLGRSQAVRQRILIPPFGGSIPPAPATGIIKPPQSSYHLLPSHRAPDGKT